MADQPFVFASLAEKVAFIQLVDEHQEKLLNMLRRRMDAGFARKYDAEDVLSLAFYDAARRFSKLADSGMSPYAWLYRLTIDRYITEYRKATADCRDIEREQAIPEDTSLHLGLNLLEHGPGPKTAAEKLELQGQVQQVLALLKATDREILWMRHCDQLSFQEIAELLSSNDPNERNKQLTENGATQRYLRALDRFEEQWNRLFKKLE